MPPLPTSASMRLAPASTAFSSSSLSTLAGRSTTSPAAIWLTSTAVNCRMRGIDVPSGREFGRGEGFRVTSLL
jgi:hypothetical protein